MKSRLKLLWFTSLVFEMAPKASAASVVWQLPVAITGASDVSLDGAYFGTWAPYNVGANLAPVNGVTFQGFSDLPSLGNSGFFDGGAYYGTPGLSGNYASLLAYGAYGGGNGATISWGGMISGHTYQVQLWANDGRNIGQVRSETLTGGGNVSEPLIFGSDGSGPGQFIIGDFVADDSGAQTLFLTPSSSAGQASASQQVNLLQVRDLGVVPELSPVIFFGFGMLIPTLRRRRVIPAAG